MILGLRKELHKGENAQIGVHVYDCCCICSKFISWTNCPKPRPTPFTL